MLLFVNTLRQNGRHFADDTFRRILFNENVKVAFKISLKFVPIGPINNIPAFVQIMTWRRSGDKLLSELMVVSLLTHISVTRPQWGKYYTTNKFSCCFQLYIQNSGLVKYVYFSKQGLVSSLLRVMAHLVGVKSSHKIKRMWNVLIIIQSNLPLELLSLSINSCQFVIFHTEENSKGTTAETTLRIHKATRGNIWSLVMGNKSCMWR